MTEEHLKVMAPDSIVFALANPDPEVDPVLARRYAAIVATGRSDEPNQINNVLAFPGIFRGLLDVGAKQVTEEVEIAAGRAIADVVTPPELSPVYIVPTVFNPTVVPAVSAAVERRHPFFTAALSFATSAHDLQPLEALTLTGLTRPCRPRQIRAAQSPGHRRPVAP